MTQQVEHLSLPLAQHPSDPDARRWSPTEPAQQGSGRIGMANRAQAFELLQGGLGLGASHRRLLGLQGGGQLQPAVGHVDRHLGPAEVHHCLAEALPGIARSGRDTETPAGKGGGANHERGAMPGGAILQCADHPLGLGQGAGRQVDIDEKAEQRDGLGARWVEAGQRPLDGVAGHFDGARGQLRSRPRPGRFGIVADAIQQLLGLLESPLPNPEVGQPDQRAGPQGSMPQAPEPDRFGEGFIGLGPAAGIRQDTAVVRAAERRHRGQPAARRDGFADPDPLVGPGHIMGPLTGREELAEDLLQGTEVIHVTSRHGCQGLVEQHHPLVCAVVVDHVGAEVGGGHELEVAITDLAGHLPRGPEVGVPKASIALEHARVERHPAGLGRRGALAQEGAGPSHPAAHDGAVADDRAVHVGQRPGHPDGAKLIAAAAMGSVGLLPPGNGSREVELEVRGPGQALDHLTGSRIVSLGQEPARPGRISGPERGLSPGDDIPGIGRHPTMFARHHPRRGAGLPRPAKRPLGVAFEASGRMLGVPLGGNCTVCGAANREGAQFCAACGAPVAVPCTRCGRSLDAGAAYCDSCGSPTARDSEPIAKQARKVLSVVFADLVGSTAMQEHMDPEAVRRLMDRCYRVLQEAVDDAGGRVVKFVGDGVMAVFGVPEIGEDDALRAVKSAANMVTAVGALAADLPWTERAGLALRVGINTGEVVVDAVDADIVGDVVNVAARLEAAAPAGGVLVGEATWRLTRHAAVFEALDPVEVRGRSQPVIAHRFVALTAPEEIATTSFVGRHSELDILRGAYASVETSRSAQLLAVVGPPGVGKTRLLVEFGTQLSGRFTIARMTCRAGRPALEPILELLRGLGPIDTLLGDSDDDARAAARVRELEAGEVGSTEDVFWAIRRLIEMAAEHRTIVVVVEDLHWAAPLLLDLVEHLAHWIRDEPVLLIGTARPELTDTRPSLTDPRAGRRRLITLEGLDHAGTEQLVSELLGADCVPRPLLSRLTPSTDGNPLFVRELVRMLLDDGVLRLADGGWTLTIPPDTIDVPPTIQSVLAARIDKLSAGERTVLERAAVIGIEVYRGALDELVPTQLRGMLDGLLESLRRKELLEPDGTYWGDERVLRFHHALIRDAAYRRLLRGERARLHERVARWLGTLRNGATDRDERIGHHLERAQADARTLGPLDEHGRAVAAEAAGRLASAADRALGRDDLQAAAGLAGRAVRCLDAGEPGRTAPLITRCEALLEDGRVIEAADNIDELVVLAGGSPRIQAWATCFRVQRATLVDTRDLADTIPMLVAAAATLARLGDSSGEAKAHRVHASVLARLGRLGECEAALDRALTAARLAGDMRQATGVLMTLPVAALWGPSPVPRAGGRCLDVIRLVRITTGARAVEVASVRCQAVLEALRGRFDGARSLLRTARATAVDLGLRHGLLEIEVAAGLVELYACDLAAADRHLQSAYNGMRDLGVDTDAGQAAALRARAAWLLGRADEAEAFAADSEDLGGQDRKTAITWRTVRADVLASRGAIDEAIKMAEDAVALAENTDALVDHADACAALSRVLLAAGRAAESEAAGRRARALYAQKGAFALVAAFAGPTSRSGLEAVPPNGASEISRRCMTLAADGRFQELSTHVAPAHRWDDRRALPNPSIEGRGAVTAGVDALIPLDMAAYRGEVLAVRGQRLVLLAMHDTLDPPGGCLSVWSIDLEGRIELTVLFDRGDLESALHELDELYVRGEGGASAEVLQPVFDASWAYNLRRWDAYESLHAPDFVMADNRPAGWGVQVGPAALVAVIRPLVEDSPDLVNTITAVRAIRRGAVAVSGGVIGDARHGGQVELAFHLVYTVSGGLISAMDIFPIEALDSALARLAEVAPTGLRGTNSATRVLDRWADALACADLGAIAAIYAENLVVDDRRPGLGNVIRGRAANVSNTEFTAGIRPRLEILGTNGDRVALVRVEYTTTRAQGAYLSVVTVDEAGQCITQGVLFEPTEVARAQRLLGQSGPVSDGRLQNAATATWGAIRFANLADEPAALEALVAESCTAVDRRPGMQNVVEGRDDLVAVLRSLTQIGVQRVDDEVIAVRGEHLALFRSRYIGTRFETLALYIGEVDDQGMGVRTDHFEPEQLAEAMAELDARYRARSAAPKAELNRSHHTTTDR